MKKWKRTVFFWILTLSCLITIPLIVLNAAGYRFDASRGVFVYSGTITFKSNPQSVNVTMDNKPADSQQTNKINNSVNLGGLLPKNYNLAISAPGFQTWTKEADVSSGLATEFWNVVLARNNYPKTRLGADGTQRFFISPKNDYVAYTTEENQNLGVGIFDLGAKKTTASLSLPSWQFAGSDRYENIEWGPDEAFLSIPVKKPMTAADSPEKQNTLASTHTHTQTVNSPQAPDASPSQTKEKNTKTYDYFIANPKDGSHFDLNQFLNADNLNPNSNDIRAVRWDPKEKGYLFFLIGKTLYRANVQTQGDIAKIADGVSAYDLSSSGVYYVQTPNNLVFEKNLDGSGDPSQITSTFPGSGNQDITRLTVYDNSRIAFLTPDGDLYVYNQGDHATYFKQLDSGIVDAQFSNDGKKLLFWSNYEISVYFTRDWTVQPTRSEDERQDITRYSEPISNVQWYSDYEHVIFNDRQYAKIIELDSRDHRNCLDLFSTTLTSPFAIYDNSLSRIYFTDTSGNSTSLYSVTFPEPTYLLGITGLGGG